jgi:hypothetical protein
MVIVADPLPETVSATKTAVVVMSLSPDAGDPAEFEGLHAVALVVCIAFPTVQELAIVYTPFSGESNASSGILQHVVLVLALSLKSA